MANLTNEKIDALSDGAKDKARSKNNGVRDNTSLRLRDLSQTTPLPNIIRVETLNANARQRYLSGLNSVRDAGRTEKNKLAADKRVFYGYTSSDSKSKGFEISSEWSKTGKGMGMLGVVKGLATKAANSDKDGDTTISKVGSFTKGAINIFEGLADVSTALTGTDYKNVGGATIKDYNGTTLKGFSVNCGWYLPEQYKMCIKSLREIIKMTYPTKASSKDVTNGLVAAVVKSINNVALTVSDDVLIEPNTSKKSEEGGFFKKIVDTIGDTTLGAFGFDLAFDPIPVRVSMGDYVDVEPLVITGLNIDFSSELYIQPNGKHMPMFATVTLTFDFWLTTSPDLQFMKLIGQEMFGKDEYDLDGVE